MEKKIPKYAILDFLLISLIILPINSIIVNEILSNTLLKRNISSVGAKMPQTSYMINWSVNGEGICTANFDQMTPQICSDGNGGAIITWEDHRSSANSDIYVQSINSSGHIQWLPNGVSICNENEDQGAPQICADGAGGAIITWNDIRNGIGYDIYAQKVNSLGVLEWDINGTEICLATEDQVIPQICSDGDGGAIITWNDFRSGVDYDIFAQKINSSGDVKWAPNGTAICSASADQIFPQICSDGMGGAIIIWEDSRGDGEIYGQRINATGETQWTINGVSICSAKNLQWYPVISNDGLGGVIVAWVDRRSETNYDIYAQRINSTGEALWTYGGVVICIANNDQGAPQICSDGNAGAVIVWEDFRNSLDYDIYAQRVNSVGDTQWTFNGVAVCVANGDQSAPQLCSDDLGGAIIAWEDLRDDWIDIYAQRVNSIGVIQGLNNGEIVCSAEFNQRNPQILGVGEGGAIITWSDKRNSVNYDIYAQLIIIPLLEFNGNGDNLLIIIITISTIGSIAIISLSVFYILRKRRKIK